MKFLLSNLILLSSVLMSPAFANSYRVTIEIRESGELRNCPGFNGWVQEKSNCVFRFEKVVSDSDARLDYTGMVGWAKQSGEVDFQYYVGDIDSGLNFKFKIPTKNGEFIFGDQPYKFEIGAGDYATDAWVVKGHIEISSFQ